MFVIDLDGVVVDFVRAYDDYVTDTFGYPAMPAATYDWFLTYPDGRAIWDHFWSTTAADEAFREAQPIPGALDGLDRLAALGPITFATYRAPSVMRATRTWLNEHYIDHPVVHVADKGSVPGCFYVDDHAGTIEKLRADGRHAFLFDQPYNRDSCAPRLVGWDEVTVAAEQAIAEAAA